MQRREFLLSTAATLAVTGLGAAGCSTTVTSDEPSSTAKRQREINAGIDASLARLYEMVKGSRELASKANGVLVFPSVIAAGFVVGGQYGEGALRVKNQTMGYYSTTSLSVGLQIGAQSKALIFLFMTDEALTKFRQSEGWSVGADASVAVLKVGANGELDTRSANEAVQAFVLTNSGLMANLTLEGTKISPLQMA